MNATRDILKRLRRLALDEGGGPTVEYMLLLAAVGLPFTIVTYTILLPFVIDYYRMVVFLETFLLP